MNEMIVMNNDIKPIKFNKEELQHSVEEVVKSHENVVYSEDTIQDARKELAGLRKQKSEINQKRIEAVKPYTKQLDDFKKEVDLILSLYDKAIEGIDSQVKDFDAEWKNARNIFIQSNFSLIFADIKQINLSQIYDSAWLRKNTSKKKIIEDLTGHHSTISDELRTLNELVNEDVLPEIRKEYFRYLKLSKALDKNKELMAIRERLKFKEKERIEKEKEAIHKAAKATQVKEPARGDISAQGFQGVRSSEQQTISSGVGSCQTSTMVMKKKMRMNIKIRAEKETLENIKNYILQQPGVEIIKD